MRALLVQWLEYAVANGVARVRFPDSADGTSNLFGSSWLTKIQKKYAPVICVDRESNPDLVLGRHEF